MYDTAYNICALSSIMKHLRSSKNLKAIDGSSKEEMQLRVKVRMLEEQVEMLQKSNLNIFIPLSQHEVKPNNNYQAVINKLKTQVLSLQHDVQGYRLAIKKMQSEREMQRINFQNELAKRSQRIEELDKQNTQLRVEIEGLEQKLLIELDRRRQAEKEVIELRVEVKFMTEDLLEQKIKARQSQSKYDNLNGLVQSVNFNSRIYRSQQLKVTAIETQQLQNLKNYIQGLQRQIKQMLAANRQEKVTLGIKRENIGEEIVRLKKNIDLQLGLPVNDASTKSFLHAYNQAQDRFDELITQCRK